MSRVVSLCLPTWPTDRLRRKMGAAAPDAAKPLVLVGQSGRRREVVAANADLAAAPEKVNEDAFAAWMFRIKPSNPADVGKLLDAAAYEKAAAA